MRFSYYLLKFGLQKPVYDKVNIGSGPKNLPGFYNIDIIPEVDITMDMEKENLPFPAGSMSAVICISAINYFAYDRAKEMIADTYRVLKAGGIARFGTQDLRLIARKYLNNDKDFFFQKLSDGGDRFPGATAADKINAWFYGYPTAKGKHCKYVYDFESLAHLFKEAGFSLIEEKKYRESRLENIASIDNRSEQMFFLEAIK